MNIKRVEQCVFQFKESLEHIILLSIFGLNPYVQLYNLCISKVQVRYDLLVCT